MLFRSRYVGDNISICTVIGFPNGYATTAVKAYEAADAIKNGADEIDMVVNISMVKDNCWNDVRQDIREVRAACKDKVLKVIIIIVILTLIWMLGIRLIIWLFAQDAFYVGSAAEYFTKYDITLEDTQTISHNGITMNIPGDYVEDEPLGNTIIYRSPDETAAVMILVADTDSNMALFSEKTLQICQTVF